MKILRKDHKILCLLSLVCGRLYAADSDTLSTSERENSYIQEELRNQAIDQAKEVSITIEEKKSAEKELVLQPGGWLSSSYRYYKNIDNQKANEDFLKWSWRQEAYFWLYLNYQSTHTVFAQIGNAYTDRGVGAVYTGVGADYEGPTLSVAYTQIDLAKRFNTPLTITAGRQHLFVGRGIAYSAIHDGLRLEASPHPDIHVKGLLSKTKPREDNLDYSVPGFDKEGDRVFMGGEIAYTGIRGMSLYSFGLLQNDLSSENPDKSRQDYRYDSYYVGAGASSKGLLSGVELWTEGIFEGGSGFTDAARTSLRETDIRAWAYALGAKYRMDLPAHPVLETSFAYGSGDDDRTRVTNTEGGDTDGNDKNFNYFGYYQAGYAFQPRLSNIKILQLGGSLKPLEHWKPTETLALGARYYFYWKDESAGGTSDMESTEKDGGLGQELDVFLHWKIMDNLSFSVRYGILFPGEAFPENVRDTTQYFFNSLTASF